MPYKDRRSPEAIASQRRRSRAYQNKRKMDPLRQLQYMIVHESYVNVHPRIYRNPDKALMRMEKKMGRPRPSVCELCLKEAPEIFFDHDHATGRPRGWICRPCNTAIGAAQEDPALLRRMALWAEDWNALPI